MIRIKNLQLEVWRKQALNGTRHSRFIWISGIGSVSARSIDTL